MAMDTRATAAFSASAVAHYRPRRCPVPMLPIPPSLSSTSSPPSLWMQSLNQDQKDQKMKQEEEEAAEKMLKMAASSKRTKRPRVDPNFVSGEQLEQAAAAADDNLMMPKLKKLKKVKKSQVVNVETKVKVKPKTKSSSSFSSSPAKKWSKAAKRRSGHGKAEHRGDKRSRRRGDDGGAAAAAIAATATATATSAADQLMAVTTPAAAHDIDIAAAAAANDDTNYQVTVVETGETVILGLKCSEPGCEEMLPSRDQFNRHLLYRHNRFPYACLQDACGKEFKVMGELGPHVRDHHSDVHEWPCAQCSHRFPTHRGLRHHLWYYHLEGLFACPTAGCPYTAHLPIAIKQHRYRLHSPTYTCEHCRKQFKQRSNLVRHLRTHSGEKPYRCNFVPVMVAAAVLAGFRSAANGSGGSCGGGNIGDSFEELSMVPLDLSTSSSSTSSSSPFSSSSSERSSRSQVKIKDEDHEEVEEAGAAENDFGECSYSSEVRSHVHRHIRTRHLKALEQQQKVNKERGAGAAFTALAAIVALINEDLEKFVIEVEDKC